MTGLDLLCLGVPGEAFGEAEEVLVGVSLQGYGEKENRDDSGDRDVKVAVERRGGVAERSDQAVSMADSRRGSRRSGLIAAAVLRSRAWSRNPKAPRAAARLAAAG